MGWQRVWEISAWSPQVCFEPKTHKMSVKQTHTRTHEQLLFSAGLSLSLKDKNLLAWQEKKGREE